MRKNLKCGHKDTDKQVKTEKGFHKYLPIPFVVIKSEYSATLAVYADYLNNSYLI
jgi:hypothetical protein